MARSKTTPVCPHDVPAYPQPRLHPPSAQNSDASTPSVGSCNALFYLFNYLIDFRVFLNNLFDLW